MIFRSLTVFCALLVLADCLGQQVMNYTDFLTSDMAEYLEVTGKLKPILEKDSLILFDPDGTFVGVIIGQVRQDFLNGGGGAYECCHTREVFYFNKTMVDSTGVLQTIAQRGEIGTTQLIRHGICEDPGKCDGTCFQVYITLHLIIYPPRGNESISMDLFTVPNGCNYVMRTRRNSNRLPVTNAGNDGRK